MDGVTDIVFRHVVATAAAPDIYMSEFTNAASFCSPKGEASTAGRLAFTPDELPMVAQIWGTNPEHFAVMSRALAERGFSGIDINMGCPERTIIRGGSCAALIQNPSLAAELIDAAKAGGVPVSVKTRIGFKTIITEQWSRFLLERDIAALTIHGRTQKEMSKVPAHWDEIGKVVKIRNKLGLGTPIIGNGDVRDRAHGEQLAHQWGVDGVMIGRGIFTNPYAFSKKGGEPTARQLLKLLDLHLDLFDTQHTIRPRPFAPLKRFFKIYIRSFAGAHELRAALMNTTSTEQARVLLQSSRDADQ